MKPINAYNYTLGEPTEPLERKEFTINEIQDDQEVVEIAGCGLCHTDLSFIWGRLRPKKLLLH